MCVISRSPPPSLYYNEFLTVNIRQLELVFANFFSMADDLNLNIITIQKPKKHHI